MENDENMTIGKCWVFRCVEIAKQDLLLPFFVYLFGEVLAEYG